MHPIVQALTHYADESGAAQILVHHGRKSDGEYRDSSAIGDRRRRHNRDGSVRERGGLAVRIVRARGRVPTANFQFRYEYGEFELVSASDLPVAGELATTLAVIADEKRAIAQQVIAAVKENPGMSQKLIRANVRGVSNTKIDHAIPDLLKAKVIVDCGDGNRHRYYLPNAAPLTFAPTPCRDAHAGQAPKQPSAVEGCPPGPSPGQGAGEVDHATGEGVAPASLLFREAGQPVPQATEEAA